MCNGLSLTCLGVGMTSLPVHESNTTRTLRSIDLSNNNLVLSMDSFLRFHWLAKLKMHKSGITDISGGVFKDLFNLYDLDLSHNMIERIEMNTFLGLLSLRRLDLSRNILDDFSSYTFEKLPSLRHLILTNNPMLTVTQDTFLTLPSLDILNTDAYKFCCIAEVEVCTPEADAFSSCTDLMSNGALQVQSIPVNLFTNIV